MSSSRRMLELNPSDDVSLVQSVSTAPLPAESRAVDIFDTFDDEINNEANEIQQRPWLLRVLKRFFFAENWFFLTLLGILCGGIAFGIDIAIHYLYIGQLELTAAVPTESGRWVIWVLWSMIFSGLSLLVIEFISPNAAGSGIPEMKCILSGIEIARYLNFKTLVAKVSGLIFAFAGGLSIGKEGPMVHICSIICSLLSKIPIFSSLRRNDAALMEVLAAACAVGTTVAFGTPIGGVLFGIEVTSSFYMVDSLWRSFFVAGAGNLVYTVSHRLTNLNMFESNWIVGDWDLAEIAAFAFMGILGGAFGGLFVKLLAWMFALARYRPGLTTWWGHVLRGLFIALLIGLIAYPFPLMRNDIKSNIVYMAQKDVISDWVSLVAFFLAKYVFTILSVGFTGCTAGIYTPIFITGAAGGRLLGEAMGIAFPSLGISPGAYAIIGAAAFTSGVTRAVSTAILAVELTGQIGLLLPVLLAVLISIGVGRIFTSSVYTVLIQQKDLPAMPRFKLYNSVNNKVAADIMRSDLTKLSVSSTFSDLAEVVHNKHRMPSFPVVDENGMFLGVVRRRNLTKVLEARHIVWRDGPRVRQPEQQDDPKDSILMAANAVASALRADGPADEGSAENPLTQQVPYVLSAKGAINDQTHVVEVDTSVMHVSDQTSLSKIHFLFTVLGLSHLFITMRGRLVGVITRKVLIYAMNQISFPGAKQQALEDELKSEV